MEYSKSTPCPRKGCKQNAIISRTYGVLPCQTCQARDAKVSRARSPEFYSIRKGDRVQRERDLHAKDLEQPFIGDKLNKKFFEAFPDKVKDYDALEELKKT